MPRGRPRKNNPDSSSPMCGPAIPMDPTSNQDGPPESASGRPTRNRIAVRKFGAASEEHYRLAMKIHAGHTSVQQQPVQPSPPPPQRAGLDDAGNGYVLIHKSFWNNMCSKLGCSSCGKKSVQMKTERLSGLACKLIMYCTACGVVLSQVTTSSEDSGSGDADPEDELDFDVNRRFVKFFVSEGKSYDDVATFSKTLGIPVISKSMFEKYKTDLLLVKD